MKKKAAVAWGVVALMALGVSLGVYWARAGPGEPAFGQVAPELVAEYLRAQKGAKGNAGGLGGLVSVKGGNGQAPLWAVYGFAFDPAKPGYELQATVGKGVIGNETLPDMLGQMARAGKPPVAGVNGDYFEIKSDSRYLGTLEGLCIVDGELVSGPMAGTFWLDAQGKGHIGGVSGAFEARWPDGTKSAIGLNCATSDLGSQVKAASIVLYTPAFGATTQSISAREYELDPVDPASLPVKPNTAFEARVVRQAAGGNCAIPKGGFVLSVAQAGEKLVPGLKEGDVVGVILPCVPDMTGVKVAIGGGPILLKNGEMPAWVSKEGRAPRTAVGIHPDGRLEFVVVDGRQPGHSIGMTLEEMAMWMRGIGCLEAMNLDGGGSTTMWYEGKVVNSPSDGKLRKVGNGLVVVKER